MGRDGSFKDILLTPLPFCSATPEIPLSKGSRLIQDIPAIPSPSALPGSLTELTQCYKAAHSYHQAAALQPPSLPGTDF